MKRIIWCGLIFCMSLVVPVRAAETIQNAEPVKQNKVIELAYGDLEDLVTKNNKIIEANKKLLEGLRRLDRIEEKRDELYNSSRNLDSFYSRLDDTSDMLEGAMRPESSQAPPSSRMDSGGDQEADGPEDTEKPEEPSPPEPSGPSPGDMAGYAAVKANMALTSAMQIMIDDLHELLEIDDMYIDKFELKFDEIEGQLVTGAKSLYIAHEALQLKKEDLERQLEVLDYNLFLADKKYEVGMTTNNERLNSHQNRTALLSGIETLEFEIKTLEDRLGALINIDERTEISFSELPKVTEEDLRFMNYNNDYRNAKKNNHALKQKQKDIGIANGEKYDYLRSTVLTHESRKIAYDAEVKNFDVAFRRAFDEIEHKARLVEEAQEFYDMELENHKLAQLKYDQGFTSNLALTTAKDTFGLKEFELRQAEVDLFSAMETYKWALRGTLRAPENPSK